jgi:hypothetical protein
LGKNIKQFSTQTANKTRFVTKIRWVIESANGRIKQWRIFDKGLPNSLLKTVGDLVAIVYALQNAYGVPFIKSTLKDEKFTEKMLRLRDETDELDAAETVPDIPRLSFEELNDLTLGEFYH